MGPSRYDVLLQIHTDKVHVRVLPPVFGQLFPVPLRRTARRRRAHALHGRDRIVVHRVEQSANFVEQGGQGKVHGVARQWPIECSDGPLKQFRATKDQVTRQGNAAHRLDGGLRECPLRDDGNPPVELGDDRIGRDGRSVVGRLLHVSAHGLHPALQGGLGHVAVDDQPVLSLRAHGQHMHFIRGGPLEEHFVPERAGMDTGRENARTFPLGRLVPAVAGTPTRGLWSQRCPS